MSLSSYHRNQIKNKIRNLFSCDVSVTYGETDTRGLYQYTAYFDDKDDYNAYCSDSSIDHQVERIFHRFGGEMRSYDADSYDQILWWHMEED